MDQRDDLGDIDLGIIDLGDDDDLELPAPGVAYRRPHDARAHLGGLDLDAFEGLLGTCDGEGGGGWMRYGPTSTPGATRWFHQIHRPRSIMID